MVRGAALHHMQQDYVFSYLGVVCTNIMSCDFASTVMHLWWTNCHRLSFGFERAVAVKQFALLVCPCLSGRHTTQSTLEVRKVENTNP